jgi:hypothetical protein
MTGKPEVKPVSGYNFRIAGDTARICSKSGFERYRLL